MGNTDTMTVPQVVTELVRCRQLLGATNTKAAWSRTFFAGSTLTTDAAAKNCEYQTTTVEGYLPDNKKGVIKRLMLRNSSSQNATAANLTLDSRAFLELLDVCDLEMFIDDVKVATVPVSMATAPPAWVSGAASTSGDLQNVQNGGWPLPILLEHPWPARTALRVQLVPKAPVTGAGTMATTAAAATFAVEVLVLVETTKQQTVRAN